MKDKLQHGKKWMPAMYVAYFGIIQEIANKHGYALCIHGSVTRDFDLVMVAFDEKVSTHKEVLNEIIAMVGLDVPTMGDNVRLTGYEPHGRSCYVVECGAGGYFDISFTPTLTEVYDILCAREKTKEDVAKMLKKLDV